jgi:hypothetical protein
MQQYRSDLLEQEVIYGQFDDRVPEPVAPQAVLDAGGAITGVTSNTLVVGPTSDPTFDDVTCDTLNCTVLNTSDDATSRANLGLGSLAIRNPGGAVANTATGVSNPPTQTEVTAIRDKLNELLNSLRAANIINP